MQAESTTLKLGEMPKTRLIGNIREFTSDTIAFMLSSVQYGDLVKAHFGPFPFYIVNHPDIAQEVFVTKSQSVMKSAVTRRSLYQAVGDGLFTSNGDFWKRQRKLAQPAFHTKRIANYADVMSEYTHEATNKWQDGVPIEMEREMSYLTMQIIAKTVFDAHVDGEDEMSAAVRTMLRVVDNRFNRLISIPEWLPTAENRDMKKGMAVLDKAIQSFIDERRKSQEDKGDLLAMLMAAQDEENGIGMTDKQLRDECLTIFGAGHETTSTALTWTFYLLSQHPEVEEKLHQELDSVLGGRLPAFEDLRRLPYTDMVFKEAMRLYPPAWGLTRDTIADVELGGIPVKKGSTVFINIIGMHHNEAYFPNAKAFSPERFSPENEKSIPKYAYLPFGAGPRVCIGNSFASMEGCLITATVAQKWRFSLPKGFNVRAVRMFTLRPENGMVLVPSLRQPILQES